MINDKYHSAVKTINSFLKPLCFHIDYASGNNDILYVYDINGYIVHITDNRGADIDIHSNDNIIRHLFNVKTFRCWNSETFDWHKTEIPNPYFGCNNLESAYIVKDLIA